eukprot:TRINITY_DN329_c0_g1_i10.p1 TRINITY_DN329_c0_g1~~TRINITY_DN329_c0_g1_i10.p1  ORF type:complete len:311 (+),score=94.73 TRINITY_DN329_c0_g1_i10:1306-2238(+)
MVYFHRFYVVKSFKRFERHITAITCMFLAAKVEESPRPIREMIITCYAKQHPGKKRLEPEGETFWEYKDKILMLERILLQVLDFDMSVTHPYAALLSYSKGIPDGKKVAQVAWNFINDSLRTTLCLQFEPEQVAAAAIYLASKYLKMTLPNGADNKPWFRHFMIMKTEDLDKIANQILDLYDGEKKAKSAQASAAAAAAGGSGAVAGKAPGAKGSSASAFSSTTGTNTNTNSTTTTTSSSSSSTSAKREPEADEVILHKKTDRGGYVSALERKGVQPQPGQTAGKSMGTVETKPTFHPYKSTQSEQLSKK